MKKTFLYFAIIASGAMLFFLGYVFYDKNKPAYELPYFGPREAHAGGTDTSYHRVGDFEFINQEGKKVSQNDIRDKIVIADFFFTTCKGICIKMTNQMERVQHQFKANSGIIILSHTVNPEKDSVPVLASYAKLHGADNNQWHFVTGDKKQIYDLARKSYFVVAGDGDGGEHDFIHTQNFVLLDKEKHIRGYYDGTDSVEVDKLMKDAELLLGSYEYKGVRSK